MKTVKSKLLDAIEDDVKEPLVDSLPEQYVRVFDGMVIIQQLCSQNLETFGEISEYIVKRVTANSAKIVYFVTDQYREGSLKSNERMRRASGGCIRVQFE